MELLSVRQLTKEYALSNRKTLYAVNGVSLSLAFGEVIGIVGESGCGKTTLANCIARLTTPTTGAVVFKGVDIAQVRGRELTRAREGMTVVFQDPLDSMNPRMRVEDIIEEPLAIHGMKGSARRERAAEVAGAVGLASTHLQRYPFQLSGGQQQRVVIARALARAPELIILDEPTSSLDFAVRETIIELLKELREQTECAYILISHDLATVRQMASRVIVMYLGRIVEEGPCQEVLRAPRHPYTRALIDSIPIPEPDAETRPAVLRGDVPSPIDLPTGCAFRSRCGYAEPRCEKYPDFIDFGESHRVACFRAKTLRFAANSAGTKDKQRS